MEVQRMSKIVYPYIANSVPEIKERLLKKIGIESSEDIFKEIPEHLRFKGKMNIPGPYLSEYELKRHVEGLLSKNKSCSDYLNFLGGGTWQHYIPAVVDTIAGRDEFLTAYVGDSFADHGKFQALFETASMIGELVDMDVVNTPTYDWANAIAISCRMAARINGRRKVLLVGTISPGRLAVVDNYCKPDLTVELLKYDSETGLVDLNDLKNKVSEDVSAVYFENPSYLGFVEIQGELISKIVHDIGAEVIVGVDPTSLGVLTPPAQYGADIVCGELQPLGIHMQWGGGLSGFIATRDEKKYVAEYPSLMFGITTTIQEGEYGFGEVYYERTSYASRENGKDFIGTTTALYGIAAGVYMALMGPQGMRDLGIGIMQRSQYAMEILSEIKGVKVPLIKSPCFKEFIVNFDDAGKTVTEINRDLLAQNIFGGKDISCEFPVYGNSSLFCITEIHTKDDIKRLAVALDKVINN
ncbi:aminomethyl-transferring glycine dehydrogenase subunit GcvPA [Alicyclobacillaceae bacterium I2511]|nr:aminomethyl-transferring glycine dehydrogenase subunit GcvPA [Alicyclobacillaceae bacterium I2511]